MTSKEAIKRVKGYLTDCFSTDCYREVEEIIEALEQQTCDDCISRQATVKRLCKVADFMNEKRSGLGSPYITAALFIRDNKDEFPPVTPKEQPCENAVSRKAAIDIIESWLSCDDYNEAERHIMRAMQSVLYDLPPVTPKEKIGRWRHYEGMLICSECGTEFYDDIMEYCGDDVPKCCPNCGARMQEVEK